MIPALILPHRLPEELDASLHQTLSQGPDLSQGVSVFVYGLLAYDPPFTYVSCKSQTLMGWQRRFHLADPMNRGTSLHPGLTLGLEQGGFCDGVSYLLSGVEAWNSLRNIWEQEMLVPFYTPTWVTIEGTPQIVMLTDKQSPALVNPDRADVAKVISAAEGKAGTNLSYLENVREGFARFGIKDAYLEDIHTRLSFS